MNEIVNKFFLDGDNVMPEMHLKQPGFTYSGCCPFTKNNGRIQKFKVTGDTKYIHRNESDKACFQHDMADGTASDKILREKTFNIAKNLKYDGYEKNLASMIYKFFDKKSASLTDKSAKGGCAKNEIKQNEQLAEELHKPINKKLKKITSII